LEALAATDEAVASPARCGGTLADPTGSALLRKVIGVDETGKPKGILGHEELLKVIGNFPISRLTALPSLGIDHATLRTLVKDASGLPG
jgi:hypothetical protein